MKFQPGESGNPGGRPKNTGHRQQLFNSLVLPHKVAIFKTALDLALSGNESMLRLFLERMLPAKPIDEPVIMDMPESDGKKAETLVCCGETILQATAKGELTPDQGRSLMAILEAQRKNIETSEHATRLNEIERTLKQRRKK